MSKDTKAGQVADKIFGVGGLSRGVARYEVEAAVDEVFADLAPAGEAESIVPVFGVFQDDPTWDRYMQNIEDYRKHTLEDSLKNGQVDAPATGRSVCTFTFPVGELVYSERTGTICELLDEARVIIKESTPTVMMMK